MATVETPTAAESLADFLQSLGNINPKRIRFRPFPGTATEADVLAAEREPQKRLCELVDGALVEKVMGAKESLYAAVLIRFLDAFVAAADLGVVLAPDGMLRLRPGLVRIPDVSYISWDRLKNGKFPDEAIARVSPNLAVEILSKGNTAKEIQRKIEDYFTNGVELVWIVDPQTKTVSVYHSPTDSNVLTEKDKLDGGQVLPGFQLAIAEIFGRAARRKQS